MSDPIARELGDEIPKGDDHAKNFFVSIFFYSKRVFFPFCEWIVMICWCDNEEESNNVRKNVSLCSFRCYRFDLLLLIRSFLVLLLSLHVISKVYQDSDMFYS